MPQQNWYLQNNLRLPTENDYVLLGNRIASDPGGQADTAASMVSSLSAAKYSATIVTPAESPYQANPNEITRVDPRTATTESDLIIRTPNATSHPSWFDANSPPAWFAVKEVYGSNKRFRIDTTDAGVVIENPRSIPADAEQTLDTGGSGEYLRWNLSDNRVIWLLVNRVVRELSTAYVVWRGITSNGDVPAGQIRATFNIKRVARTATGVYDVYPDGDVPSTAVLFSQPSVSTPNLGNDQFGQGYQMSVTYGAEDTAKITYQYGYRTKAGNWVDSDFAATGDEMVARIFGVA